MYLHIGEDFIVSMEHVLYIISSDLKEGNKEFLEKNHILEISEKLPVESLVGMSDGTIYGSPVESITLLKRWEENFIYQ